MLSKVKGTWRVKGEKIAKCRRNHSEDCSLFRKKFIGANPYMFVSGDLFKHFLSDNCYLE